MTLTAKDVAEITRLLEQSSFDELYLELDGVKLSLRRGGAGARAGAAAPAAPAAAASTSAASTSAASTSPASAPAASALGARAPTGAAQSAMPEAVRPAVGAAAPHAAAPAADPNSHDIVAPLLGTFYRAPKPGAPPFVEVGSLVEEETIIGIIEVMKLMNTVRAGVRGRVTEILARDGVLVEYGEALMRVGKTS